MPKLCIDILCAIEDGTERASLKLLDQDAISAFGIPQDRIDYFKQYCSTYGNFFHPNTSSEVQNKFMHNEILKVFKQSYSFSTFSVLATPFCKINYDKNVGNESVSRPNYVSSETEKNLGIYLNGEVTRKPAGFKNKIIRKVKCSFKAVDIKEVKPSFYSLE